MRRLTKTHGHARTSSIIGPLALHICLTNNFAKQPALFYPINDMLCELGKPFLGIDFSFILVTSIVKSNSSICNEITLVKLSSIVCYAHMMLEHMKLAWLLDRFRTLLV